MWYQDLFDNLEQLGNQKDSIEMSQYMKNKFKFLGIKKPILNNFIKPYLKESKNYDFDYNFVNICYQKDYREAQYIAIEYLKKNIKYLNIEYLKQLIITKSWWDTVDSLDSMVGSLLLENKELESVLLKWSLDDNIWLRRVAIDYQQKFREKTNNKLLERIIINNLEINEFFINKAIGWSIREYSKINPLWVKEFLNKYEKDMSNLSVKEAKKYISI